MFLLPWIAEKRTTFLFPIQACMKSTFCLVCAVRHFTDVDIPEVVKKLCDNSKERVCIVFLLNRRMGVQRINLWDINNNTVELI